MKLTFHKNNTWTAKLTSNEMKDLYAFMSHIKNHTHDPTPVKYIATIESELFDKTGVSGMYWLSCDKVHQW